MEQIHKERLLKLADFLETIPDKHFDLEVITDDLDGCSHELIGGKLMEVVKGDTNCGAIACCVGWLPGAFPDYFKWDEWASVVDINNKMNFSAALEFFNLDIDELDYLFDPSNYETYGIKPTKQNAIARIREFAKNS